MPSPIPVELTDQIIDDFEKDHDMLRTCCLVSRYWISRARHHRFSLMKLEESNIEAAVQLFKASPWILGTAAQSFVTQVRAFPFAIITESDGQNYDSSSWEELLGALPAVQSLCIRDSTLPFLRFFRRNEHSQSYAHLRYLRLRMAWTDGLEGLAELLSCFPQLEILLLYNLSLGNTDYQSAGTTLLAAIPTVLQCIFRGLKYFQYHPGTYRLPDVDPFPSFVRAYGLKTHIRTLDYIPEWGRGKEQRTSELMDLVGPSLAHFSLSVNPKKMLSHADLRTMKNLKSLSVGIGQDLFSTAYTSHAMPALREITSPLLEVINIFCSLDRISILRSGDCASIDVLLAGGHFPDLKQVTYFVSCHNAKVDIDDEFIRELFPALNSKGLISFKCFDNAAFMYQCPCPFFL